MISEVSSSHAVEQMSSSYTRHLPFRNSVHLSQAEAYDLMRRMLSGEMGTEEIADVLNFIRRKGETIAELVGFANALRDLSKPLDLDQLEEPLLDTCGTGGDGACTFNISTTAAFVVAGAGLRVAKHGNRRISSQCGSSDLLEQLGIPINLPSEQVADCIRQVGIGFLYAPLLHPAVKHAQEARLLLKGRTAFNLLGPLTNPVRARIQLMGAFSVRAAEMLAQAAARLGIERAYVVHGADGLDEITTTTYTTVFQVENGSVGKGRWSPADFGVEPALLEDLKGDGPEANAATFHAILEGELGPKRDIVVANAAAALFLTQRYEDLKGAVAAAIDSLHSGAARRKFEALKEFTQGLNHESI